MAAMAPNLVEEKYQAALTAWETLAPDKSFGGMTLAQFKAIVKDSMDARQRIRTLDTQMTDAIKERENADTATAEALELVVNGVLTPLFSEGERDELVRDAGLLAMDAPLRTSGTRDSAIVAGARRAVRERVQAESLARLEREVDLPGVRLPFLFDEAGTPAGIRLLALRL